MGKKRLVRVRTRNLFILFLTIVAVLVLGTIGFVQSARFAKIVKSAVAKNIPEDWGIEGDFSEFRVKIFPPGISINDPKLTLNRENIVNLPEGSRVTAERIDFLFYPLQMFTGNIRLHEAVIVGGDVQIELDPEVLRQQREKERSQPLGINWDDLFQIQTEAVSFENTRVRLKVKKPEIVAEFVAERFRLAQTSSGSLSGFEIEIALKDLAAEFPEGWKIPRSMERMSSRAFISSQGISLDEITVASEGILARLAGEIEGDLLEPEKLILKSSLTLKGDLNRILRLAEVEENLTGIVQFEGDVQGDLLNMAQTFKGDGRFRGNKIRYDEWSADSVKFDARWRPKSGDRIGEVLVSDAEVFSINQERGFDTPATGGRIKIERLRVPIGGDLPVKVSARLEGAHFHWLAAPIYEDVFNLDYRVTGDVGMTYIPKTKEKGWSIESTLGIQIGPFVLDNKKPGRRRELSRLLAVPDAYLAGGLVIDEKRITPKELKLRVQNTEMSVGGSVGMNGDLDLKINGGVSLADFDILAERKIHGDGNLSVHVRGDNEGFAIDFDTSLKGAEYLNLRLGDVKGLITYDDKAQKVLFQKVRMTQANSKFLANGYITTDDPDKVNLDFDLSKGDVSDLILIFDRLVDGLWWFPESLTGEIAGKIKVRGGLDLSTLSVLGDLKGKDWDFLGEKLNQVDLRGGYDKGTYSVNRFNGQKYQGKIDASISYNDKRGIRWKLKTQGFELSDIDQIARLDVPLRGGLNIESTGKEEKNGVVSDTKFSLEDFVVRGLKYAKSDARLKSKDGRIEAQGSVNGNQGLFDVVYDFNPKNRSFVSLESNNLDFTPILLLINPTLIDDPKLAGAISGQFELAFKSDRWEMGTGKLRIGDYFLRKRDVDFRLVQPVSAAIEKGSFEIRELAVRGDGGVSRLNLKSTQSILSGELAGEVDLSLAEFFTPVVSAADGVVTLDYRIGGSVKKPILVGRSATRDASFFNRSLETRFEDIQTQISFNQGLITVERLRASLAQSRLIAGGEVDLFLDRFPRVNLFFDLDNNKLKVFPFQFIAASGRLTIKGTSLPYLVEGDIQIREGFSQLDFLERKGPGVRKTARYTPKPVGLQEGSLNLFALNLNATAPGRLFVKNNIFDAELRADTRIVNTINNPRILGQVGLVKGSLRFKDQVFKMDTAEFEFDSPTVLNPKFVMSAKTQVKNTIIQLYASGRMEKWKVELSSDPVLPESEILSLLALGLTSDEMKRFRSGDRYVIQQGVAASLLLDSFGFNRGVKDKTGFEIQVEEASSRQLGTSAFNPNSINSSSAAPKIVIKRRIGKNVNISVGSTVGVGTGSEQEGKVEVEEVVPGVSVIGVWNKFEGTNTQDIENSYGVDLKFEKRFD